MAEENFEENNMAGEPDNSNPPEIQEQEPEKESGAIVVPEKKWPGWPGENVFRMLVPVQKVGGIIGRKGEFIKKMCEETKARIKILEGPPGATERTVLVSAKEEPDNPMPPAMEGLLKVHTRMVDLDSDAANAPPAPGGIVCTRLLLAATQAGSLIGKQGATIKSIQDASNCVVRVLGSENLPPFALPDDSIVEVQGEPSSVHKGVELIATHLRKFLVDRSVVGIFEAQMQMHNRGNQDMAPPPMPWAPPQGFPPMNAGGGPGGFMPNHQYMPPPSHQFDNYYPPPAEMPPMDKQQRQPPPAYGRDASLGAHTPSMQPPSSIVTKVTQNMQIPLSYADAVIGISGSNISYIRRTSGATIAIQETRGIPGEMTVEINGSASQVQTAQQLIQNSIAEAASASQNTTGAAQQQAQPAQGGQVQGYYDPYNPAASQGHADGGAAAAGGYGYQPSNPNPAAGGGDYGSVYGTNYGY